MLSLASTDVAHYEPRDREAWDEQYDHYRSQVLGAGTNSGKDGLS